MARKQKRTGNSPPPSKKQLDRLNRAIQFHAAGDIQHAAKIYRSLVSENAPLPTAFSNLGIIRANAGDLAGAAALLRQAVTLNPGFADAHNNLGNIQQALGDLDGATASYKRALEIRPDYAEAYNNLGLTRSLQGKWKAAIACYGSALEIRPDYAEAWNNLGDAHREMEQFDAAVENCEKALKIRPDFAEAYINLGAAKSCLQQIDEAIDCFEKALRINPRIAAAHNNLGNALKKQGNFSEAAASYQKALTLNPGFANAHRNLSALTTYRPGDPHLDQMAARLSTPDLSDSDRMHLCFALAKAYDDLGRDETGFRHLVQANRLRKKLLGYDIRRDLQLAADIKKWFRHTWPVPPSARPAGIRPVFIVGMPRSGTTLVEQILASHSEVYGAGELDAMNRFMAKVMTGSDPDTLNAGLMAATAADLRQDYLAALADLKVRETVITDKMPKNFMWTGFILTAFPEAAVIHLKRTTMATCWSVYKTCFSSKGNGYAYDMKDLAAFYHLYEDLMSFWEDRFPGRIHTLFYEDLTENQEAETRNLLDYCGLPWADACLSFHKTERMVNTASAAQVRKKMYTGSSDVWKRYKAYLEPLMKALES